MLFEGLVEAHQKDLITGLHTALERRAARSWCFPVQTFQASGFLKGKGNRIRRSRGAREGAGNGKDRDVSSIKIRSRVPVLKELGISLGDM